MTKRRIILIALSIFILSSNLPAAAVGVTEQPIPWLDWGVDARGIGLGRSNTVIDSRGAAIIYNPAELAWQKSNYLTLMHTPMESDFTINYDYLGVGYRLDKVNTGFGIGYQRLAVEYIEEYNNEGQFVGFFDDVEQSLTIGFGQMVIPDLAVGGAVKLIKQNMYDDRGSGYSLNLGMKWQPVEQMMIGAMVNNLTGQVKWSTDHVERQPLRMRLGALYMWPEQGLKIMGEYLHDQDDSPIHLGIEKEYKENLRFRAGLDGLTPTFGLGLIMGRLEVDYALMLDLDSGKRQYLSLNWRY